MELFQRIGAERRAETRHVRRIVSARIDERNAEHPRLFGRPVWSGDTLGSAIGAIAKEGTGDENVTDAREERRDGRYARL